MTLIQPRLGSWSCLLHPQMSSLFSEISTSAWWRHLDGFSLTVKERYARMDSDMPQVQTLHEVCRNQRRHSPTPAHRGFQTSDSASGRYNELPSLQENCYV